MQRPRQESELEQPLYIRWTPDTCPYALEMRLSLITRLKNELDESDALGFEIAGIFAGAFPTPDSPILRLEDVLFLPRNRIENIKPGAEFELAPAQLQRMTEIVSGARRSGHPDVGFFRSERRSRQLAPSSADLAMLSQQFADVPFAFFIIGPRFEPSKPRIAAFYLAVDGILPSSPSWPVFPFDESAFESLPELPAGAIEGVRKSKLTRGQRDQSTPWPAVISLALLIFLIGTWILGGRFSQLFRPDSNQIDLSVMASGSNLKITWDHSSSAIARASGATLLITDGSVPRQVKLDTDDLKLGQIAYERLTKRVYVLMRIDAQGKKLPPQTFDWTAN